MDWNKTLTLTTFLLTLLFALCKSPENTAVYQNPVYQKDFPDPTVIKGHDGFYYAYATQSANDSATYNIQVAKSKDLTNWQFLGDALPDKPAWASTTQDFWAPHVLYDVAKETYYMYYSGESDGEVYGKCLGVATSQTPEGPFVDKGEPLLCGEGFVNIDPMAFDDPETGKKLLFWGSGFEPIKVRELADNRLDFKGKSEPVSVVSPGKDADYSNLIEGAWVHHREGFYYLFYSGDNCCGENANYAVMVARSGNATGPYERLSEFRSGESSTILVKNGKWLAPGHNSVITDEAGGDWIFYHAIPEGGHGRILLTDELVYENGWPAVKDSSPGSEKTKGPVIKSNR